MQKNALWLACALLAGCEYTVPLVSEPAIPINRQAIGLWQSQKESGQGEELLVLPLGANEYLVAYPAGAKDAMFARACLWQGAGMTLAQLNWIGTARAKLPENNRTYQYASFKIEGDTLRIRMMNSDVVKKEISSPGALEKAIKDSRENPELFQEEAVFKRPAGEPAPARDVSRQPAGTKAAN